MKKGFKTALVLLIVCAVLIAGSISLYHYLPITPTFAGSLPNWLAQKNEDKAIHDQQMQENIAKPFVREAINNAYFNIKAPAFQTGVVSAVYGNPLFPEEIAAKYSFTNQAITRYSRLVAGTEVDDPTFGVIVGLKWDPTTSQDTHVEYDFPGAGSITFASVQGDVAYFKTANGGNGELNAATGEHSVT